MRPFSAQFQVQINAPMSHSSNCGVNQTTNDTTFGTSASKLVTFSGKLLTLAVNVAVQLPDFAILGTCDARVAIMIGMIDD